MWPNSPRWPDPATTLGLIDVAKKNIVLSQNLGTLSLVRLAEHLAGGGRSGPAVTALTDINSGGIPCVK